MDFEVLCFSLHCLVLNVFCLFGVTPWMFFIYLPAFLCFCIQQSGHVFCYLKCIFLSFFITIYNKCDQDLCCLRYSLWLLVPYPSVYNIWSCGSICWMRYLLCLRCYASTCYDNASWGFELFFNWFGMLSYIETYQIKLVKKSWMMA